MTFRYATTGPATLALVLGMASTGAQAEIFEIQSTSPDLVGQRQSVSSSYADTFTDLGRLHNLGYEELRAANPAVDPWLPGEGPAAAGSRAPFLPKIWEQHPLPLLPLGVQQLLLPTRNPRLRRPLPLLHDSIPGVSCDWGPEAAAASVPESAFPSTISTSS